MPAEFDAGFFVRTPAWHGMGTVLDDYPESTDEALRLAGLDWEPITLPVYGKEIGFGPDGQPVEEFLPIPGFKLIARSDTHKCIAIPKASYELFGNRESFEIVEEIVRKAGKAAGMKLNYETAGSLKEGAWIWALVRVDEPYHIPGDPSATYPYVSIQNTHDGSAALRVNATQVRIVCANTWMAANADSDRSGLTYTFRHTKTIRDRVDEAVEALAGVRQETQEYVEMATHLASIKVTPAQAQQWIKAFIPDPADAGALRSDRVAANISEARNAVWRVLKDGVTTEGINTTAYGLLQAGIEYADWLRPHRTKETLFGRQLLRPEPLKAHALRTVRDLVSA